MKNKCEKIIAKSCTRMCEDSRAAMKSDERTYVGFTFHLAARQLTRSVPFQRIALRAFLGFAEYLDTAYGLNVWRRWLTLSSDLSRAVNELHGLIQKILYGCHISPKPQNYILHSDFLSFNPPPPTQHFHKFSF